MVERLWCRAENPGVLSLFSHTGSCETNLRHRPLSKAVKRNSDASFLTHSTILYLGCVWLALERASGRKTQRIVASSCTPMFIHGHYHSRTLNIGS